MYNGIGQYFPFHVEMNLFQRRNTAFTLSYAVRILGEAPFFSLPLLHVKGKKRKKRGKKRKKRGKKGKKMYLFIWGTIRDRCRGRIFLCWNEELASANEPGIHSEEQNLSQSPVVKQDGDGCLSAELSNLRGHFETRWEGLGFLLRPFSEHFYLLQWVAMAPPSQRREGGNSRNTGRLQQIKSCHWEQITTHLDNF